MESTGTDGEIKIKDKDEASKMHGGKQNFREKEG